MGPKTLLSAACAASLVAGAALGIFADRVAFGRGAPAVAQAKRESFPVARLADALDLDQDQLAKVRATIEAYRPRYLEVMKDVRPKLRELHEQIDAEIRPILRPDQVEKLAALRRETDDAKK